MMSIKKISERERQRQYQEKYKRVFPYNWLRYCGDPLELVENWDKMIEDTSDMIWELHHRDEIQVDVVVSRDELMRRKEYYNLPANKLIFLKKSDHMSLHNTGKKLSGETKDKITAAKTGKPRSKKTKNKISKSLKGRPSPMYGKTLSEKVKKKISENRKGKCTGDRHPMYGINKYDITEEDLYELYVEQRLTQREISEKFGCSRQWISKKLKEFGIKRPN